MSTDEHPIPTQNDKLNSDATINGVRYKPPECCTEQVDRHNAVSDSDEISRTGGAKIQRYAKNILHIATNL